MEHYKLVYSVQGRSLEISSHEKDWVESKEKQYKELIEKILSSSPVIKIEKTESENLPSKEKPIINNSITINEFYRSYIHGGKVKSLPDIATFLVYFLSKIQKSSDFNTSDIKDLFKSAGYPKAERINISDVLARAKKKAFLNNFDNQWTLTITGDDFVLNTMSDLNE